MGPFETFLEYEATDAEGLLDLLHTLEINRDNNGGIIIAEGVNECTPQLLAMVKTAEDLKRQSPGFKFRAIMEGWSLQRINQEMY